MRKLKKKMKDDYYLYLLFLSYLETLAFFVCLELNYRTYLEDVVFFLIFIPLYAYFLFYMLDLHFIKAFY